MADRERFNLNLENNDESFDLNPDQGDEDFIVDFGEVINTGAVTSYNELTNKPSINDVELRGNKTSEELGLADNSDITDLQEQIDAITVSSDVVDVLGTYQDLLDYDTSELGDNDIVKVLQDSTHGNAMSYYRWNKTAEQWVYVGSEGPFYTKSESDTKYQEKLVSGTNIKTINNNSILGSGNLDIEAGGGANLTPLEVPDDYMNLMEFINDAEIPETYTISNDNNVTIAIDKEDTTETIYVSKGSIISVYPGWSATILTGDGQYTYFNYGDYLSGGASINNEEVETIIDEKLGSDVVMTNTEQEISGKKTFTSPNGTIFENEGGTWFRSLYSSPAFKIIPDNNGNIDFYYHNTQLGRIYTGNTVLYSNVRPNLNETVNLGTSSYNWNKIYSKTLASGNIEKNVANLLTNDADIVPTYGNTFALGSASRLWNILYVNRLNDGTNNIAISNIATKTELAGKQDTLTAGTGIAITNNVISSTLEGIDYEVDQELPQTGEKGIIYLIPNGSSEQENIYDEYIWIPPLQEGESGRFEFIGTTQTDLTNYVDLTSAQTITGLKTFVREIDFKYANSSTYKAGIVCPGNNKLGFGSASSSASGINSYITMDFSSKIFYPGQNGQYSLGTSNSKWNNLYLSGNLSDGTNEVAVNKIANKDNFVTLSQADYDALATKDPDTYYFIEEE